MLGGLFACLFITLLSVSLIPARHPLLLRYVSLAGAGLILILSCLCLNQFNSNFYFFQNFITLKFGFEFMNIYFNLGLDGISILFFVLSSFLIFFCLLFCFNEKRFKFYSLNLLSIELLLLFVFSSLDIFLFYVFFEAILIPMFLLIGILGTRERKIRASYLFMFYTLFGSLFLLIGLLYIYVSTGTLEYEYLVLYDFTAIEQYWLWLAFFLSFAAKVPVFPFHIWLPEAHVEAPTVGSVLLAGILLKLGVYGFLRFSLVLFPTASLFFAPFVYLLSIFGAVYASFTAIRQSDIKRIIAYSSVAHMNLVVIGLFSFTIIGLEGALLQSVSHGFVASGLFLIIGILYIRYHSRFLYYYSGLVHMMPFFSSFFFFTLANIALPGTSSFIGEFFLLLGIYGTSFIVCFLATTGVIFCGSYSLWLYNRLCFGNLKKNNTLLYKDLSRKEFIILFPFALLVLILGIKPMILLEKVQIALLDISLSILM